jgi:hypothetical protein
MSADGKIQTAVVYNGYIWISAADSYVSGNVGIGTNNPGSYQLYVGGSGYLNAASWTYGSDRRLKENIEDLSYGLDTILSLNPKKFDYISGGKNQLGFVAQDIQTVIPEIVEQRPDGMLGLKTDMILPVMVNAIKQQQDQIVNISLKTNANVISISDLQASIDQQPGIVSSNFADIDSELTMINTTLASNKTNIDSLQILAAQLQVQINEIKAQTNSELNIAQIDLNKQDIIYLKMMLGITETSESGDIAVLGKLKAKTVEAGKLVVSVDDLNARTIGDDAITAITLDANSDGKDDVTGSDGKSYFVKTTAVNVSSKIFITPKVALDQSMAVTEVKLSEGFTVTVKNPLSEDAAFDWVVMDEKL